MLTPPDTAARWRAKSPLPLVMGLTNDGLGYAPDRDCAARGGYAADMVLVLVAQQDGGDALDPHADLAEAGEDLPAAEACVHQDPAIAVRDVDGVPRASAPQHAYFHAAAPSKGPGRR